MFLTDIDDAKINKVTAELQKDGHSAGYLAGDVLDETFADKLIQAAIAEFGQVTCLINNAGVYILLWAPSKHS